MWPARIAGELRDLGHDVCSVQGDIELAGQLDQSIFDFAQRQKRAVFTDNVRDYALLARQLLHRGERHCGLVFTSNRSLPRAKSSTFKTVIYRLDRLMSERDDLTDQEIWL